MRSALDAHDRGHPVPARGLPALSDVLARLTLEGDLGGRELASVGRVVAHSEDLRRWVTAHGDAHPALGTALATPAELGALGKELALAIEEDGAISDRASPALHAARRDATTLRAALSKQLQALVRRHARWLSQDYSTERDGRPVLPVRAEAHAHVPGIVLGSSASGRTLFVEPREATEAGNGLRVALARVEREEHAVRVCLSARCREHLSALQTAHEACVASDQLQALVRWAVAARAVVVAPSEAASLELYSMRHPLLVVQGQEVVANDLGVTSGGALILSGPNAGGKTVALECLGLAAWMARAAIPIPARDDSVIGWFDHVLTDIGDEQSLVKSLSTFSGHVTKLAAVLARAGPTTLVLLDEVLSGTDPEEGAALAVAVLEALLDRGAAVVATTHYERLKEHAARDPRFENASVGLILETLAPTFRVVRGSPGPSSALIVAERYGIEPTVVARAASLVPEHARARERLLLELATERERLDRQRTSIDDEHRALALEREQLEQERQRLLERERDESRREARALVDEVKRARAALATLRSSLSDGPSDRSAVGAAELRSAERQIDEAAHLVAVGSPVHMLAQDRAAGTPTADPALAPGDRVLVTKLGVQARVVELAASGELRVLAGQMRLVLRADEVHRIEGARASPGRGPKPRGPKPAKVALVDGFIPLRLPSNTLDLRGERVEEALERVERFVDELSLRGERAGFVLHGHGTGALKSAVRAHLASLAVVRRAEPASPQDGGDAFTLFRLDE